MRLTCKKKTKRLIKKDIIKNKKFDLFIYDDIIKLLYILFDLII